MHTGVHLETAMFIPLPTSLHGKLTGEFKPQVFSNNKS